MKAQSKSKVSCGSLPYQCHHVSISPSSCTNDAVNISRIRNHRCSLAMRVRTQRNFQRNMQSKKMATNSSNKTNGRNRAPIWYLIKIINCEKKFSPLRDQTSVCVKIGGNRSCMCEKFLHRWAIFSKSAMF